MGKQKEIHIIKGTEHPEEFNPIARKQKEIREGVTKQQKLRGAFADKILTRHKMTRDEALWEALAYMGFLHSQGVVIKVGRELPECAICHGTGKCVFTSTGEYMGTYEGNCLNCDGSGKDKANLVAVEPLIKEE